MIPYLAFYEDQISPEKAMRAIAANGLKDDQCGIVPWWHCEVFTIANTTSEYINGITAHGTVAPSAGANLFYGKLLLTLTPGGIPAPPYTLSVKLATFQTTIATLNTVYGNVIQKDSANGATFPGRDVMLFEQDDALFQFITLDITGTTSYVVYVNFVGYRINRK